MLSLWICLWRRWRRCCTARLGWSQRVNGPITQSCMAKTHGCCGESSVESCDVKRVDVRSCVKCNLYSVNKVKTWQMWTSYMLHSSPLIGHIVNLLYLVACSYCTAFFPLIVAKLSIFWKKTVHFFGPPSIRHSSKSQCSLAKNI